MEGANQASGKFDVSSTVFARHQKNKSFSIGESMKIPYDYYLTYRRMGHLVCGDSFGTCYEG